MLYCPNFFWNVLQVWMTGKDVYLQMTWSWPDKTWNILCSYCLQWNTSQSKFRNHYFLFLFAFSILSQLFLIWGCNLWIFSSHSVSHYPSEIILICWFAAQETFLIINSVENCSKEQHLLKQKCFVTQMSLLLLINLMHPCWIKVLIVDSKLLFNIYIYIYAIKQA